MKIKDFRKEINSKNESLSDKIKKDLSFQIGRQIEKLRIKKGLTQVELAKILKTTQSNISRAESGSYLPGIRFLKRLADSQNTYLIVEFGFLRDINKTSDEIGCSNFENKDLPRINPKEVAWFSTSLNMEGVYSY